MKSGDGIHNKGKNSQKTNRVKTICEKS